jgi:hypothetical protein
MDFADVMYAQLDANMDKGGWYGCTAKYLFKEMYHNMSLARLGIENQASVDYVTKKLANVANYSMMLADNYDREHEADGESKGYPRSECDHSTYVDLEDSNSGAVCEDGEPWATGEDDCND